MKKTIIALAALATLGAQINTASGQTAFKIENSQGTVDMYSLPQTTLAVTITQSREVILRGTYARYASQYLGIIGAPQTDKEFYTILDAKVAYSLEPNPTESYVVDEKSALPTRVLQWPVMSTITADVAPSDNNFEGASIANNNPFTDVGATILSMSENGLSVDRSGVESKSPEDMAAEAAATIFKLRKRRIELISGDQGENVFGAGLKAALDEIARLEKEYLELFVGKRYLQTTTKTYYLTPKKGELRAVVCRFSEEGGLTDATNLSAQPVNIELVLEAQGAVSEAAGKAGRTVPVLIPAVVKTKVSYAQMSFGSERIPVYQFGTISAVPVI